MPNVTKERTSFTFPILVSILVLVLVASCGSRRQSSEQLDLVWESWEIVKSSYVVSHALDPEKVTGEMIGHMLEVADKPAYPFLAELEEVSRRAPRDVPPELIDLWRAWVLFGEKWPEVSEQHRAEAAIQGMLTALPDISAARHLNPEAYSRAKEDLTGSYEGIGAVVQIQDGYPTIVELMEDKPAEKAGLQPGDAIHDVDGVSVKDLPVEEAIKLVRGRTGTKVTLLVAREGEEELQEINVTRGAIEVLSVEVQLLPGGIGYMYIAEFRLSTGDEVLDALEALNTTDFLALILDLRGNPGGSLEAARDVASQFIPDGLFMYAIDKEGNREDWFIDKGEAFKENLPIAVVVSEFTASAAEALAGALQDRKQATIIGVETFGKGSASAYQELSDGSALYLPVAKWFTPNGNQFQGRGITPDILVDITAEDLALGRDSQIIEAYNYLDNLLPPFR